MFKRLMFPVLFLLLTLITGLLGSGPHSYGIFVVLCIAFFLLFVGTTIIELAHYYDRRGY